MKSFRATILMLIEVLIIIAAIKTINHPFASPAAQWFLSSVAIFMIGFCGKKLYDLIFHGH